MVNRQIQTIVGAGQTGLLLARHLSEQGHTVRLVCRGNNGRASALAGVTLLRGDAMDAAFMANACSGSTAVYNCANPSDYTHWHDQMAPLFRAIWQAAARAGARLVQLDNLYMYGRPTERPFDESTAQNPCSHKGELRRALAQELLDLHRAGTLKAAIGRAADFVGPQLPNTAVFRPSTMATIKRGGRLFVPGNPDMPHGYSFVADVARGLAVLGQHDAALGRVFHLPVATTLSTRELVTEMAARAGTHVKVTGLSTRLFRTLGIFSPMLRALGEMNYQFEIPFVPDDSAFRRTFKLEPTSLANVIDTSLACSATDADMAGARATKLHIKPGERLPSPTIPR
ncbi:MAG: NAD-dependent epimerase/dehydratase family protein [Deltaproteobacteria bacterium]|nr:NAD-dependent epimerase/dehydratase family protein [Deltaproteobacteria bacterium]